jgi:uncharacterized phiE125 gp8 family phage protein
MSFPTITTNPTVEPVSLEDLKIFCRVDYDDDDDLLAALGKAARQRAEDWTGRAFVNQTRAWMFAAPKNNMVVIPNPNVSSVSSVTYYDTSEALTTVATTVYRAIHTSDPHNACYLELLTGQVWPDTGTERAEPWTVNYICGYGATAALVPEPIRMAIKIAVATWYEHREGVVVGTITNTMPNATHALMADYRWRFYA